MASPITESLDHPHDGSSHGDFQHVHVARLSDGMDFINTLEFSRNSSTEELQTPEDALRWLRDHELMHHEAVEDLTALVKVSPRTGERVLNRVRKVRAAMRELVEAAVERRPPDLAQLGEINRALRTHYIYELVPARDGVSLDHRHEGDPVDGALARLAESLAREVSQGDPERLRICANDTCRWVFVDTSRTGRRKWCDMSTCGNKAKAARFRERHRAPRSDEPEEVQVPA
jgi:predicted RNA-binding Zn ribbon-like protein